MVDKPADRSSDDTLPQVGDDLVTLKSDRVADVDQRTGISWLPTSSRGIVLYALAAIAAIILGAIPALWINRWRADARSAAPRVETELDRTPAAPRPTVEPIEMAPAGSTEGSPHDEAAVAAERARAPTGPATPGAGKRTRPRPEPVKPPARAGKRATPPCDIYLHPHGCPR